MTAACMRARDKARAPPCNTSENVPDSSSGGDWEGAFHCTKSGPFSRPSQCLIMLQRPLPIHDENRAVLLARPAHDEENAVPGLTKAAGKSGKANSAGSTRKALGNITNASKAGENRQAGKGPGRAPRKALGDITNATPRDVQPLPKAQKPQQAHTQAEQV